LTEACPQRSWVACQLPRTVLAVGWMGIRSRSGTPSQVASRSPRTQTWHAWTLRAPAHRTDPRASPRLEQRAQERGCSIRFPGRSKRLRPRSGPRSARHASTTPTNLLPLRPNSPLGSKQWICSCRPSPSKQLSRSRTDPGPHNGVWRPSCGSESGHSTENWSINQSPRPTLRPREVKTRGAGPETRPTSSLPHSGPLLRRKTTITMAISTRDIAPKGTSYPGPPSAA
jgi:hypothetical protein